jgi:hypothetical protein
LSFSNLDFNLWHTSERRDRDTGHGIPANPDGTASSNGGTSWYFGYESTAHPNAGFNNATDPLSSTRADGQPIQGTYNFAGGAVGVLESQPFSLAGMVASDLPTMYFSYFLSTQEASSADLEEVMRDSMRVYGAGDNGQWILLATNNDASDSQGDPVESSVHWPVARTSNFGLSSAPPVDSGSTAAVVVVLNYGLVSEATYAMDKRSSLEAAPSKSRWGQLSSSQAEPRLRTAIVSTSKAHPSYSGMEQAYRQQEP